MISSLKKDLPKSKPESCREYGFYSIPDKNCMIQGWTIRRKGDTCLKTSLMIARRIDVRKTAGHGNSGNIKSLIILNSYLIKLSLTCCPHTTIELCCVCNWYLDWLVWLNCEVVEFLPWSGTATFLDSVYYGYVPLHPAVSASLAAPLPLVYSTAPIVPSWRA